MIDNEIVSYKVKGINNMNSRGNNDKYVKPRRTESILKYFFQLGQAESKPIEVQTKVALKRSRVLFPSLYHKETIQYNQQSQKTREELQSTIFKLKSKHFGPHGAAKTPRLQAIKRKRLLQLSQKAQRTLSYTSHPKADLSYRIPQQGIISCTIEESIYYG